MASVPIAPYRESGFTLIELLVTIAILGILSGLALESFYIYRENAYHAVAQTTLGQARISLEAGKSGEELDAPLTFSQSTPGAPQGPAAELVPALIVPGDSTVYVHHDPTCALMGCMEDYIITRHCRAKQKSVYFKPHKMPPVLMLSVEEPNPC